MACGLRAAGGQGKRGARVGRPRRGGARVAAAAVKRVGSGLLADRRGWAQNVGIVVVQKLARAETETAVRRLGGNGIRFTAATNTGGPVASRPA
ncbi:hypothetical protein E2562_012235 [Oryza meyeriana var. granulata]|uniref:Uncharacterized protein n=1 Tax=Oryza meyeriana var. granulata TaxID=110450 RepID=A0A6G1D2U1_9ORYZ|nr:hypothetical protein E2562_012235 [Oryza meyeriana var. granulata]